MSFGFSVGDFVLLLQIARTQYKNCVAAGVEYNEIAREVKSLYSILKLLRDEAQKTDSPLLRNEPASTTELVSATEGCRHILEDLQTLLAKFEGLSGDGEAVNPGRKLWHRIRFGSKVQALGEVRGKIITYTSTISVLLDAMQLKATGRLEDKVDEGFANVMNNFQHMRKAIVEEVLRARAQPKGGSTVSLLSLSTYNEDDKEVWQEFRRELVTKGFKSKQLDRHKDILKAYMLKLEQCGVLDQLKLPGNEVEPWWRKHVFSETTDTISGLQPIVEEGKNMSQPLKNQDARELPSTWHPDLECQTRGNAADAALENMANVYAMTEVEATAVKEIFEALRSTYQSPRQIDVAPLYATTAEIYEHALAGASAEQLYQFALKSAYERLADQNAAKPTSNNASSKQISRDHLTEDLQGMTPNIRKGETGGFGYSAYGQMPTEWASTTPKPANLTGLIELLQAGSRRKADHGTTNASGVPRDALTGLYQKRRTQAGTEIQGSPDFKSGGVLQKPLSRVPHDQNDITRGNISDSENAAQGLATPAVLKSSKDQYVDLRTEPLAVPGVVLPRRTPEQKQVDHQAMLNQLAEDSVSRLAPANLRPAFSQNVSDPGSPVEQRKTFTRPREPPIKEQIVKTLPEDNTPITFSIKTPRKAVGPNTSQTSLLTDHSEDGSGVKVLIGAVPKKFAYAEPVADWEPEHESQDSEDERPTVLVPKSRGGERQSPRTSDMNTGVLKAPQVSPGGQNNDDRRFILLRSDPDTTNRTTKSVSPTLPGNPSAKVKFPSLHQSVPPRFYPSERYTTRSMPKGDRSRRQYRPPSPSAYSSSEDSESNDNKKEISSRAQKVAKVALLAGATEAFRVRHEPGDWTGEKGKRILTAAISDGLAANRLMKERRPKEDESPRNGMESLDDSSYYDTDYTGSESSAEYEDRRTHRVPKRESGERVGGGFRSMAEEATVKKQYRARRPAPAVNRHEDIVEIVEERSPLRRKNNTNTRRAGDRSEHIVVENGRWNKIDPDSNDDIAEAVEERSPTRRKSGRSRSGGFRNFRAEEA